MHLLIVTPKVDQDDENLGAFYYWFETLAKFFGEVTIITPFLGVSHLPAHVTVVSLGKESGESRPLRFWKFLKLFWRFYPRSDAVIFHMIPEFVLIAAPFLIARKKVRALWYAHGAVTWKVKCAERLVDFVFTSSLDGFRYPSKKVFVLGQAINTAFFKPADHAMPRSSALRLITIGRIAPVKDYETILAALKILKDTWNREWKYDVVGGPILPRDEKYLEELKKMARAYGISDRVTFLGPRTYREIPEFIRGYDVFINCSRTGSLDKAVLEAMASGLTVITANEAYRAILRPRFFLEHKSPQFLAGRIKALADDPRPDHALREIVEHSHGLDRTMERMARILKSQGKGEAV